MTADAAAHGALNTMRAPVPQLLAGGLAWPEGPTILPDGSVAFVECAGGRISRFHEGTVRTIAHVGGGPNAVVAGDDDFLYFTQNGGVVDSWVAPDPQTPGVWRVPVRGGDAEPLVTDVGGKALLRPNDLAFSPAGALYFTDPGGAYDPGGEALEGAVYRIAADGSVDVVATTGNTFVNGVLVGEDGTVWWTETYVQTLRELRPDTDRSSVVAITAPDSTPDGFAAARGRLLVCAGTNIEVIGADCETSFTIPFPQGSHVTNCVFDGDVLYVTDGGQFDATAAPADGRLWSVDLAGIAGAPEIRGHL